MNKRFKTLLILTLLLGFTVSTVPCQTSSTPIWFIKKEIAFFKWDYFNRDGKKCDPFFVKCMGIDGQDNLYFLYSNLLMYIVSADGKTVKTIDWGNKGGGWFVDEDGNLYSSVYKKREPEGFILTKPDGSQIEYKNFTLNKLENGIAYDFAKNKSITIIDEGDKPEKLPPQVKWETKYPNNFTIYTEKLNSYLKKINRHIDSDKIQIKIDEMALIHLMGIDDNGNSYFFCAYQGQGHDVPWIDSVMVYSSKGQKNTEVPLEFDFYSKRAFSKEVVMNIHGDFFQIWATAAGLHITKWTKN